MSPLVVGSSACGDMKSCDGFCEVKVWIKGCGCQRGTGLYSQRSGVRGQFSIRSDVPVYMRAAWKRDDVCACALKAALGVSEFVGLTCESGLAGYR